MSDATSPSPADWAHRFYHPTTAAEYSTVVTTASAHPAAAGSTIEGRVAKPGSAGSGRRRSRASRRAPTTLLNTDTANFRAMVQQFTGAPPGPPPPYPPARPVISFGAHQPAGPYWQQQQPAVFAPGGSGSGMEGYFRQLQQPGFNGGRNGGEVVDGLMFLDGMGGAGAAGDCRPDGTSYFL